MLGSPCLGKLPYKRFFERSANRHVKANKGRANAALSMRTSDVCIERFAEESQSHVRKRISLVKVYWAGGDSNIIIQVGGLLLSMA